MKHAEPCLHASLVVKGGIVGGKRSECSTSLIFHILFFQVVEELSKVEGLSKILVAEHEAYKGFLPGINVQIMFF